MAQPNGNQNTNVNSPSSGKPVTSQNPGQTSDSKNAGRFENPKESEINESQEGEWKQPGQDEFPGVENAPRTDREKPQTNNADNPRRYI